MMMYGCEFSIKKGSLLYKGAKLVNLFKIKGLSIDKTTIVYSDIKETILESSGGLWGIDSKAEVLRLR